MTMKINGSHPPIPPAPIPSPATVRGAAHAPTDPSVDVSHIKRRDTVFRNWSGSIESHPRDFFVPHSEDEIATIMRLAIKTGRHVRVVGSGHSSSAIAATDDILVSLDELQGPILSHPDKEKNEITINAGVHLHDLGEPLRQAGFALRNMGDIDEQTLGGALGTGTHGSGTTLGSLSSEIVWLRMVTPDGKVIECSPTKNGEIFKAARLSLGALGIITQARMHVDPAYDLHLHSETHKLDDILATIDKDRLTHDHLEVFWNPTSDDALVQTLDKTSLPPHQPSAWSQFWSDTVLDTWVFGLAIWLAKLLPFLRPALSSLAASSVPEQDECGPSYEMYAHNRDVRFEEMEYAVAAEEGPAVLREIREFVRKNHISTFFPIEYRYVKGDDIALSQFQNRDSATISAHVEADAPVELQKLYFGGVEEICRRHNGRPHLGKVHSLEAAQLSKILPGWAAFQKVRNQVDPQRVLSSPGLDRLLGP